MLGAGCGPTNVQDFLILSAVKTFSLCVGISMSIFHSNLSASFRIPHGFFVVVVVENLCNSLWHRRK